MVFRKFNQITPVIGLLAIMILSSCAMKGYQVDLAIQNQNDTLSLIKTFLENESYVFAGLSVIKHNKGFARQEKYKKELSDAIHDHVIVDVVYPINDVNNIDIWIYNKHIGNEPQMKPSIKGIADELEETLKASFPKINIVRKEYKTGYPIVL